MFITDKVDIKKYKGEIGIEVEVEGNSLPPPPQGWRREEDGSLRGESGEYVMTTPCVRNSVSTYLSRLYDAYEEFESTIEQSPRQSVHVHVNVQTVPLQQVFNIIILYLIFEEVMIEYCGEGRSNNLFCLRSQDAQLLLTELERSGVTSDVNVLDSSRLRYSSLNVTSLFKYGSLEFRGMRGGTTQKVVEDWVGMLLSIKDYAMKFDNPVDLMDEFRKTDIVDFTKEVFTTYTPLLNRTGLERKLLNGARNVKMIAYMGDWEGFDKEEVSQHQSYSSRLREQLRESRVNPTPMYFQVSDDDEEYDEEDEDNEGDEW